MLKQKADNYITSGNLFKGIILFTIPLFLATLVQTLFTAVDTMVVGNFANATAVAAIGASNSVISLLLGCFTAIATGAGVIVSRAIGANNAAEVKKAVDTSIIFSVVLGTVLMIVALLLAVPALKLMNCPQDCFDSAVLYLKIYMVGTPASMIYNFASAIIRAEGDSRRPLIYIIISGSVNVVLNVILCLILTDKVAAVAISTVVSQVLSATMTMVRLVKKQDGYCRFSFTNFRFHMGSLGEILRFSIPLAVTSMIYPLANLQIYPVLNGFGTANLAGWTAAGNIDGLCNPLTTAFHSALLTFASQNIGAHNRKRVEKTLLICTGCALVGGMVIGWSTSYVFPDELLSIFLPGDQEAIFYGKKRMEYLNAFLWLTALIGAVSVSIQAFGYPVFTTLNNVISVLGFRIIWMNFVYPLNPTVDTLYVCFTISWGIMFVIAAILFVYAFSKYRRQERIYERAVLASQNE